MYLVKQSPRFHTPNTRHISQSTTIYSSPKTIEDNHNDAMNIGNLHCSQSYVISSDCNKRGCTRLVFSCTKNVEKQRTAHYKRQAYLATIDNTTDHLMRIKRDLEQLWTLERRTIYMICRTEEEDDLEPYEKTLTLINHKVRCLHNQIAIIKEDDPADDLAACIAKDIKIQYEFTRAYVKNVVPGKFKSLCYPQSNHPDIVIMYKNE